MFFRHPNLEAAVKNKLKQRLNDLNQPVWMTDLIVEQTQGIGTGEYHYKNNPYKEARPRIIRMLDLIELIISIGQDQHHQTHFTRVKNQYVMKPAYQHHITRLISHEFFFYTDETPLSQTEWHTLLCGIDKIVKGKSENLHVILASFPVVYEEQHVANHAIYIQCGPHPKINVTTKAIKAKHDLVYKKNIYLNYEKLTYFHLFLESDTNPTPVATILPPHAQKPALNYGGIIPCITAGGAGFTAALDICVDHSYAIAKNTFARDLMLCSTLFFPNQISYVLTSNWVELQSKHTLGQHTAQADPRQ